MAYALSGLGMYYYLTRDEHVLRRPPGAGGLSTRTLLETGYGLVAWVRQASPDDRPNQKELVAQLEVLVCGPVLWLAPDLAGTAWNTGWPI